MQFASGDPSNLIYKRDLQPEVSENEAHTAIARDSADFMDSRCVFQDSETAADAATRLSDRLHDTLTLIQPILDSLLYEVINIISLTHII